MYAEEEGEVFLGRSAGSQHANVSGETAKMIDQEVRRIIDDCYGTAKRLLDENRDKLEMMADALMKYETIDSDQIDDIMAGRVPREPRDWQGGSGTGTPPANLKSRAAARTPSHRWAGRRALRALNEQSAIPDPTALRQSGS